jgi:twitching motility protein PilT
MAEKRFTLPTVAPTADQPAELSDSSVSLPITPPVTPGAPAPVLPPLPTDAGVVRRDASADESESLSLDELLLELLRVGGSDLHLSADAPPRYRVQGDLEDVPGYGVLTSSSIRDAVYSILTERQKKAFEENLELDLAYELTGAARFRVNVMRQQGKVTVVMRAIPWEITPLESLGMPAQVGDFAVLPRGLVLVTGPTGSGKSTTLAAIIDKANRTRKAHIVTIEDPIEFVHPHRMSTVNQREIGEDTHSFADASSIQAVVCQALCKKADGTGRVAATEVMVATPAIRNLIREGKLQSIPSALQTGSKFGMHTLNQDLASLVEADTITYETAVSKCSDVNELNQLLGRVDDAAV